MRIKQVLLTLISSLLSLSLLVLSPTSVKADSWNTDLYMVEGQSFQFQIPDDAFPELGEGNLSYQISGLPDSFLFTDGSIQAEAQPTVDWRCDTPFDRSIAGHYPISLTATNRNGETADRLLNLHILVAPFIVDIDATWNYFSNRGCQRNLPTGIYKIEVINRQQGGRFDAWTRKELWEQGYYVSPMIGRVERVGRYATLEELFDHPMPDQILDLPMPTHVSFYLIDTVDQSNNKGGVSLKVASVQR